MNSSLDTNIILRYLLADIPDQAAKAAQLIGDTTQTFRIYDLTIAEVVYNLQIADVPRAAIVEALTRLFSFENIRVDKLITNKVLPYFAEHPALSFVDCCTAFYAENDGTEPLWTFDKKLSNQHPSAKRL